MVRLSIEIEGNSPLTPAVIEQYAARTLAAVGVGDEAADLGVQFVDEQRITELNSEHRGVSSATDVLSFPIDELDELPPGVPRQLGDVAICIAYVRAQLVDGETMDDIDGDLVSALKRCLVHGVLHLVGEDHERGDADAARMLELEQRVLDEVRA